MGDSANPQEIVTPTRSAIVDGRVNTSGIDADAKAAATGGRVSPNTVRLDFGSDTPADPTTDPAWQGFQEASKGALSGTAEADRRIATESEQLVNSLPPDLAALMARMTGGKPAQASPAALAAPAQQPAQTPTAQPAATTTATPAATTEDRTTALAALKRDGWTDGVIAKLSDQELLTIGKARHDAQAAIDAKLNERRQERRETGASQPESGATPASGGPGQTAPPTLDAGIAEALAPLTAHLTEAFGEEIGKPIAEQFQAALKKVAGDFEGRASRDSQTLEAIASMLEGSVTRSVRNEWKTAYPDALKPETWAAIKATYEGLTSKGLYQGLDGMESAWEHARRIHMPGVQARASSPSQAEQVLFDIKNQGRPTTSTRAAAQTVGTEDQELFNSYMKSHQLSEAMAAAMGAGR